MYQKVMSNADIVRGHIDSCINSLVEIKNLPEDILLKLDTKGAAHFETMAKTLDTIAKLAKLL